MHLAVAMQPGREHPDPNIADVLQNAHAGKISEKNSRVERLDVECFAREAGHKTECFGRYAFASVALAHPVPYLRSLVCVIDVMHANRADDLVSRAERDDEGVRDFIFPLFSSERDPFFGIRS